MDTKLSRYNANDRRKIMGVQNRRKYDSDFKLNAVLLSQQPGRRVSEVTEELGINSDRIYQWKKAFKKYC